MENWWVIIIYVVIFAVVIAAICAVIRFVKNGIKGKQEVRSIRVCPKCGERISGNYCSNCGEKVGR